MLLTSPYQELVENGDLSRDEYVERWNKRLGPSAYCGETTNAIGQRIWDLP